MNSSTTCAYCGLEQRNNFPPMKTTPVGSRLCFDNVKCEERRAKRIKRVR